MNHLSQMTITISAGDAVLALAAAAVLGVVVTMLGLYGKLAEIVEGNRTIAEFWRDSYNWMVRRGYATDTRRSPTTSFLVAAVQTTAEHLSWLRWPRSTTGYAGRHRLIGGAV